MDDFDEESQRISVNRMLCDFCAATIDIIHTSEKLFAKGWKSGKNLA